MSMRLMVDRYSREPVFIIYPNTKVEFRDSFYLEGLRITGFYISPEKMKEVESSLIRIHTRVQSLSPR